MGICPGRLDRRSGGEEDVDSPQTRVIYGWLAG